MKPAKIQSDGKNTDGVIVAFGGLAAGLVLYVDKGIPIFDYNFFEKHTIIQGAQPLPSGKATVEVDFDYHGDKSGGPSDITLKVNRQKVASGKMEATVGGRFGADTFGVGVDTGQPVTPKYDPPFAFTGRIEKVVIEVR